ncbi:hypothetical protein ABL78_5060 [Leptomonas seymouri]|uniref:Uncharacterized protein n=1 Tax=Leptomonas seymouri TaxID=5684 RepID=A0A0N0P4Z8_LEPSE|nr:hypothetical protein ABL78_5060 [Leptomonas seymouri]|eukprot:KPI85879.1 hypothetical protein ABL78_5060 [Leptomonas seymouri]
MRGLLSLTRRLGETHGRRRVPRSLQGLPTPNVHRSWGNMKGLSPKEKEELVHGEWRRSKPIQLVADKSDRDGGGFAAPVTFSSEEEAQQFLAEEDADDAAELRESTLTLAQRFFVELAATADEEVDSSQMPPAPQSDEERRREMREVQRQFFADFYVAQGLISEAERYAFVDTLLRPSRALFLVNSTLPLVRLTVRDQLESHQGAGAMPNTSELKTSASSTDAAATTATTPAAVTFSQPSHASSVFTATDLDACLYAIPLVPTQPIGAPLYVPYTTATDLIQPPESPSNLAAGLLEGNELENDVRAPSSAAAVQTGAIDSVEALGAMLQEDFFIGECNEQASREEGSKESEMSVNARGQSDAITPCRPPTLAHMYWLQRQVASNSLLNVDLLSYAISLLSVHLAASAPPGASIDVGGSDQVIVYQADTTAGRRSRLSAASTYHVEIAQYLFRSAQEAEQGSDVARQLQSVVIAVEDATFTPSKSFNSKRQTPQQATLAPVLLSDASDVPVVDRYPNLVYVTPSTQQQHRRSRRSSTTSLKRGKLRTPLRGRVVVCVPTTSQDGVRPRAWLSSGESDDIADSCSVSRSGHNETGVTLDVSAEDESVACIFSVASPNVFVDRCQLANANFKRLQQCLYNAIRAVDVGCARDDRPVDGGWVIYATQSMNVIENEAVVCAVLQRVDTESREADAASSRCDARETVLPSVHVECVPCTLEDMERYFPSSGTATESLRLLREMGRMGLSTWVAIEGGSLAQEAEKYPLELRTAVAQASWRTDPMRKGDDGGYAICIRVTARGVDPIAVEDRPLLHITDNSSPTPALRWWTHPQSRAVSAVTPAVLRFLERVSQPTPRELGVQCALSHSCRVLHAGVPVGVSPLSLSLSSAAAEGFAAACSLSSATTHAEVLAAMKGTLPVLRLSALAFGEFLLLKQVSSRRIRKQLQLRDRQLPVLTDHHSSRYPNEEEIVTHESLLFLAAVEDLIGKRESSSSSSSAARATSVLSRRRFNLVVEADPDSFVPRTDSNGSEPFINALHPAVAAELQAAGVVAQLEYVPRSNGKASTTAMDQRSSPASSLYDFTLRLDVGLDIPERTKHLAALEEWRVALRDALLYVYRRTGAAPSVSPRLWTATAAHPNESGTESEVRLPRGDEEGLELAEDEYEAAVDMSQHLQRHSEAHRHASSEFASARGHHTGMRGSNRSDWLEDTNYREWRQRRFPR